MPAPFQSTRPSRASTAMRSVTSVLEIISIHKALAGLDFHVLSGLEHQTHFNPQGPRGPRLLCLVLVSISHAFQSTRPSRASTFLRSHFSLVAFHFNPQGPRGPRRPGIEFLTLLVNFNPQGPRGPRRQNNNKQCSRKIFQSTRPSRASTIWKNRASSF